MKKSIKKVKSKFENKIYKETFKNFKVDSISSQPNEIDLSHKNLYKLFDFLIKLSNKLKKSLQLKDIRKIIEKEPILKKNKGIFYDAVNYNWLCKRIESYKKDFNKKGYKLIPPPKASKAEHIKIIGNILKKLRNKMVFDTYVRRYGSSLEVEFSKLFSTDKLYNKYVVRRFFEKFKEHFGDYFKDHKIFKKKYMFILDKFKKFENYPRQIEKIYKLKKRTRSELIDKITDKLKQKSQNYKPSIKAIGKDRFELNCPLCEQKFIITNYENEHSGSFSGILHEVLCQKCTDKMIYNCGGNIKRNLAGFYVNSYTSNLEQDIYHKLKFIRRLQMNTIRNLRRLEQDAIRNSSLSLVYQIGPNREKMLNTIGITKITELASQEPDQLRGILLSRFPRCWNMFGGGADIFTNMVMYAKALVKKRVLPINKPVFPKDVAEIFIDLEYIPGSTNFLYGVAVKNASKVKYYQFFLEDEKDKLKPAMNFIELIKKIDNYVVYTWAGILADVPQILLDLRKLGENNVLSNINGNHIDLYKLSEKCLALPLYSYSMKEVLSYLKIPRKETKIQDGFDCLFSYSEYCGTKDDNIKKDILEYNLEDLKTTIRLKEWIENFFSKYDNLPVVEPFSLSSVSNIKPIPIDSRIGKYLNVKI